MSRRLEPGEQLPLQTETRQHLAAGQEGVLPRGPDRQPTRSQRRGAPQAEEVRDRGRLGPVDEVAALVEGEHGLESAAQAGAGGRLVRAGREEREGRRGEVVRGRLGRHSTPGLGASRRRLQRTAPAWAPSASRISAASPSPGGRAAAPSRRWQAASQMPGHTAASDRSTATRAPPRREQLGDARPSGVAMTNALASRGSEVPATRTHREPACSIRIDSTRAGWATEPITSPRFSVMRRRSPSSTPAAPATGR